MPPDLTDALLDAIATDDMTAFDEIAAKINAEDDARQRALNANGAMRKAAEWYARKGIPVLPVAQHGTKLIARTDATTDQATIARWWTRNPKANIATPTGRWCDVITVNGPAGYLAFADLREAGAVPKVLARSVTPSDGMQVFVPVGEGVGSRQGIDHHGAGGYVLLPPSYVVEDGQEGRHFWTTQPDWNRLR